MECAYVCGTVDGRTGRADADGSHLLDDTRESRDTVVLQCGQRRSQSQRNDHESTLHLFRRRSPLRKSSVQVEQLNQS